METIKDMSPNHTQIPNDYLDMFMPHLTGAEWKCLCYIARRTFGFQKRADQIAFSQFENGITTKDGKVLDYGTGLSRPKISESLHRLIEVGLLESKDKGNSKEYLLVKKLNQSEVVKKLNQTGKESLPKVVKKLNIQKKEKESIQKKDIVEDEPLHKIIDESKESTKIAEVIKEFENVNPACKRMYGNITQRQAVSDLIDTYTYEKVINVIRFLPKSNTVCFWKATTPKQLWDNWANIQNDIISKFNKEATKKNNVAF